MMMAKVAVLLVESNIRLASVLERHLAGSTFAAKRRRAVLDESGADGRGEAGLREARVTRGHGWQVKKGGGEDQSGGEANPREAGWVARGEWEMEKG